MNYIIYLLNAFLVPTKYVEIIAVVITAFLFILLLCITWWISKEMSRKFLNSKYFDLKSEAWNKALKETNFLSICGYVISGFIAYLVIGVFFPKAYSHLSYIANKIINIYFLICIIITINKILTLFRIVHDSNNDVPVKGFVQFLKIFVNFFGVLIVFAYVLGKEPTYFVSALGIIASVLMIVFKDTIVGLTAGWQISMNKMVKLGDWIEMPKYNADGVVVDISLTTVYVQNWDNKIVTIPSYDLISSSFQNWRKMQQIGTRRIKRSFYIDLETIKFANKQLIQKLEKFELLKDYITTKEKEISEYNKEHNIKDTMYNGRYLTNIGLFRIYCQQYIQTRKFVDTNFTTLVRQLEPTPTGLPLEIYCFIKTTEFAKLEVYQSDIFDHLLSIVEEFELSIFQEPSGKDIKFIKQ